MDPNVNSQQYTDTSLGAQQMQQAQQSDSTAQAQAAQNVQGAMYQDTIQGQQGGGAHTPHR